MTKDDNKILKSNLSTLLKRFSNTDLISSLDQRISETSGKIQLSLIDDNHVLKKARINEKRLDGVINNIKDKGVTSPLLVVQHEQRYEIVYPRIVYIACLKLKLDTVPFSILNMEEEEILVFLASSLKNIKGANIVELSLILNKLKKKYKYKQNVIADLMGQSRSQITNIMRLKRLPEWLLRDLSNDKLSFGHARALINVDDSKLKEYVDLIYKDNLSVRALEKEIYKNYKCANLKNLEDEVSNKHSCIVNITANKVSFSFKTSKERDDFISKILK